MLMYRSAAIVNFIQFFRYLSLMFHRALNAAFIAAQKRKKMLTICAHWLRVSLLAVLSVAAVGVAEADELIISGSGNPEYVLGQLAKAFNSQQSQYQVSIPPSNGSAGAYRDVLAGTTSMGRVGRRPNDDERRLGIIYVPLGRDAVVFVAGAKVTLRTVTLAQMADVFSGTFTNWQELKAQHGPIRAVGREGTDASLQVISRASALFKEMKFGENVKVVHLDPQLIEVLDRYPTSLGFLNRSGLYAAKTKLVPLALDSVEPTLTNMESGRYPLWLEFGMIYKAGAITEAGRAFLKFLTDPAGVRILRDHGISPNPTAG
jgi:phosphate transport system substrate-binding protein